MTVDAALQAAVVAHQNGDLAAAEKLYVSVLKQSPENADAHNLLGVLKQQAGLFADALSHFDRAIAASPKGAMFHFNRANALRDLQRTAEAEAAYRAAVECDPTYTGAALNLGVLLVHADRALEARGLFQQIVDREPANFSALLNLGKCLHLVGEIGAAHRTLKKAIEIDPNAAEAHLSIARVYIDANNFDAALPAAKKAVEREPDSALAHVTLSIILSAIGSPQDAMRESAAALELDPEDMSFATRHAWNCHKAGHSQVGLSLFEKLCNHSGASERTFIGYADVLRDMQRPWDALGVLHKAPAADTSAVVLTNMGATFQDLNFAALAVPFFQRAAGLDSGLLKPSESLAFQLLQLGHLDAGWARLDARLDHTDLSALQQGGPPFWRGEDLNGKTLFVFFEQGAGEHIIQSSMLPSVAAQAGHCIVECAERLTPILRRSLPNIEFISGLNQDGVASARQRADFQIPGLHLGRHCRTRFSDFNDNLQPLRPDTELVNSFRRSYEKLADGRRIVGISWISGSTNFGRKKTIPLEEIGALFDPEKFLVISLQYGSVETTVENFRQKSGADIHIDTSFDQMKDLESFFAQVASMDLVVTISNTTAHVGGATGTPTWVLLPDGSGSIWYWFLDRDDSPWHPSARLFRSKETVRGEGPWWRGCIADAKAALKSWLKDQRNLQSHP
jgi:tetratricopeptide (TPR) repeat protein